MTGGMDPEGPPPSWRDPRGWRLGRAWQVLGMAILLCRYLCWEFGADRVAAALARLWPWGGTG